jgi:NAD(P)-dependent dehydrogenase (short-subunit alcohol dehydrogenase family)
VFFRIRSRANNPEAFADSIAFLLADASRWITGSVLIVDGGYTAQ